jgi:hypothetical protein
MVLEQSHDVHLPGIETARELHHPPGGGRIAPGSAPARPSACRARHALQFEANQRQRGIVGKWVKLDEPTPPTDIVKGGLKWYGATWSMVKSNVLEMMPSKTARRKKVVAPLRDYPMVVEELAHAVHADRCGPMIVHPQTGAPTPARSGSGSGTTSASWSASITPRNWNRDLRASASPRATRPTPTSKIRLSKPVNTRRQLSGTTSVPIGRWCGLRKNVAPTAQSTTGTTHEFRRAMVRRRRTALNGFKGLEVLRLTSC